MAYLARLKSGNYTDSDIKAFYIDRRFNSNGFIREVGDFIAHPQRDKGASFDATIGVYSQFAFFQRYKGTSKKLLEPTGECEWWLKPYFDQKVEFYSPAIFKKRLKMSKSEVKQKIASWFPSKERFPKRIEALNLIDFHDIVSFFSESIGIKSVFDASKVKSELKSAFKEAGLSSVNIDDFLIGTSIILKGMKVELAEGVSARVTIGVNKNRQTKIPGAPSELLEAGGYFAIIHPDGPLEIDICTETPAVLKLCDVAFPFLDTEIDTEPYFDRSLIYFPYPQSPALDLKKDLQFVSNATPKVTTY